MNLVLYKIEDYRYVFINIREDGRRSLRMVFWFMILKLSSSKAHKLSIYKAQKRSCSKALKLLSSKTHKHSCSKAPKLWSNKVLKLLSSKAFKLQSSQAPKLLSS